LNGDRLTIFGIGTVRVVLHRPLEGNPKIVCVRRSATGKWYVTFSCEWDPTPLPESPERVGIDVGLASFAVLSTGESVEHPRFFRQEEKTLATAQRRLAKEAKGTPTRRKRRKPEWAAETCLPAKLARILTPEEWITASPERGLPCAHRA
jgi:putative transposase